MIKRLRQATQCFIILVFAAVGGFVVYKNFPLNGQTVIEADPSIPQAHVYDFGPEPRILKGRGEVAVVEGPVYFDTKVMPWHRRIRVEIIFQQQGLVVDKIGYQTGPGFQYQTVSPVISAEGFDQKATAEFDTALLYRDRNRTRILLDVATTAVEQAQFENHLRVKKIILTYLR